MTIDELEKKPHNEWTQDEIIYWLTNYAQEEMLKETLYYGC